MSKEAVVAFREKITSDESLQETIRQSIAAEKEFSDVVRLGKENGFEFTEDEAAEVLQGLFGEGAEGELSDFELEMVAGGKGGSRGGSRHSSSGGGSSRQAGQLEISTGMIRVGRGW